MTKSYTYETGKIYCIMSKCSNKCYVGHTIQPLKVRLQKHKTKLITKNCHSFVFNIVIVQKHKFKKKTENNKTLRKQKKNEA